MLAMLSTRFSPLTSSMLMAGLVIVGCLIIWPYAGLLATAAMVPLERFGRFTDDDSSFTFSIMRIGGLISLGSFMLHWLLTKRRFRFPSPLIWYGLYMTLGCLSMTWTSDLHYGLNQLSMQLGNMLFFFVVLNLIDGIGKARLAIAAWLLVATVIAVATAYQWNAGDEYVVHDEDYYRGGSALTTEARFSTVIFDPPTLHLKPQKRAVGTTSHPGAYGLNLLVSLPLFIYFFRTTSGFWIKLLIAICGSLACYNVMITNTRAVLITFVMVAIFSMLTGLLRLNVWLIGGAIAGAVLAFMLAPADIKERLFRFDEYFISDRTTSFGARVFLGKISLEIFSENPLFGVGLGNQVEVPLRAQLDPRDHSRSAHSDLIATLVEVGFVGLVFVAGFLVSLHRRFRFCERIGLASSDHSSTRSARQNGADIATKSWS